MYKVTDKDLKGDIEDFPISIVQRMVNTMEEQFGELWSIDSLQTSLTGAFSWDHSREGNAFWTQVIMKKNYKKYFEQYPEEICRVEDGDLTGDLRGFPKEIVQKMLERQYEQTGGANIAKFRSSRTRDAKRGGFDWASTEEGMTFWDNVLRYSQFQLFFEKYPINKKKVVAKPSAKPSEYVIVEGRLKSDLYNTKDKQINGVTLNTKTNGKVQRIVNDVRTGEARRGSCLYGRGSKTTIRSRPLANKKITGF